MESDYPYTGVKGECKDATVKKAVKINTWDGCVNYEFQGSCLSRCTVDKINTIIRSGPYATYIHATDDLVYYTKGVLPSKKCNQINHAVAVVQVNRTEGFVKFKNSWGEKWGESGFGRLAIEQSVVYKSAYACFALNAAYYPWGDVKKLS